MNPPKCKVCGQRHWKTCFVPPADKRLVKATIKSKRRKAHA